MFIILALDVDWNTMAAAVQKHISNPLTARSTCLVTILNLENHSIRLYMRLTE